MEIRTNNKPRRLESGYQLTDKERAEFDYLDADEIMWHDFVRYKGHVYDVSEFMRCSDDLKTQGWHGMAADSAFSGILIKLVDGDNERVVMGQCFC